MSKVTPEMLIAAQKKSELGTYICSNWAGAYDVITELYEVMDAARESEGGEAVGVVTFDGTVAWFPGAKVHAGMEVYSAPQPDKWIPCSDGLPKNGDGYVWIYDPDPTGGVMGPFEPEYVDPEDGDTHWMPTGLTRPAPPEQESE